MKTKFTWMKLIVVAALLFSPTFTSPVQAADSKSASISVPISTGLNGNDNAAKTFYLDLPNGVTSSSIKAGTLKYSGNNTVNDISIENGKIKLTLKGVSKSETFNVEGKDIIVVNGVRRITSFITNPGNSIWRYADGRRWQFNDWNPITGANSYFNADANDIGTPSNVPPTRKVSTKSDTVDPSNATWLKNGTEEIPYSSISQSSVKLEVLDITGGSGKAENKNGKIVVTYQVPSGNYSQEQVPASFDNGGWVTGRLYFISVPYYYTGVAKLTTYSYSGNVTFDYSLPTEPTLDGGVSVMKPSPNPAKFEGKDTEVSLKVKGDLLAYTTSTNIEEWVFYAKETGSSDVKSKKDYSKVLTSTQTFDNFVIPKSRGSNVKQEYTLTVTVRFSKPVETSSGTLSSLSKTMKATVEVSANPVDIPSAPVNNNKPPVAVLDVSDEVMAGSETLIYGKGSYDPDGRIVDYEYSTPGAMEPVSGEFGWTWYPLSALGQHSVRLTVTDNGGLTGSTSAKVNVIQPIPRAAIKIGGTKKENRKVILTNKSTSPEHYPIDDSKTQFTLAAVSGGSNADIKYSGTLSGFNEKDVLFKKAGTYRATITVTNTAGFSDSTSETFDIIPDEGPVVYISVPTKVYRDPSDGNKASIAISDMSFSPDYDFLAHRLWQYRYDLNNNNSFADESWVTLSDSNESQAIFKPNEVGRYEIRLTITEEFDQPTIAEFVTQSDRRQGNSDTQSAIEKIITVYNRAPVVDWSW